MTSGDETRIRKPMVRLLAGGLVASISLCAVFYLLLLTTHPPVAQQPGSAPSVNDFIDGYASYAAAYASWQHTYASYAEAYGLSFLAALGFVVASVILVAPRLTFLGSFSLLNVYFAWTSHLLAAISASLQAAIGQVMFSQTAFLWTSGKLAYFVPQFIAVGPEFAVADLEALALLGVLTASVFLLNRGKGAKRATLLALQVAALSLTILGAEIAMFDSSELYLHVTQAQELLNFEPSFTNADLLLSALAMLAVSTCLLNFRRLWHQRY